MPHACGDEPGYRMKPDIIVFRMPHACGDEPYSLPLMVCDSASMPHACGDEPVGNSGSVVAKTVCPTHVGMNRE